MKSVGMLDESERIDASIGIRNYNDLYKIFIETEEVDVAASLQFVGLIHVVIGFNKDVKNFSTPWWILNFYMKIF